MHNKIAMFKRWIMMLNGKTTVAVQQGIGQQYSKTRIEGYYNDLTSKVCQNTELDGEGIPVTSIADGEKVYFPIAIFQYGLGCYDLFLLTQDSQYKKKFYQIVSWAINHILDNGSWDCFSNLKSNRYNVSSMCQGEGASLLFRAYADSEDIKYRYLAEKALDFMLLPMEQGGTAIYENGKLFLEEYPQRKRKSVLNGWIFSIFGLYDASIVNPDKYDLVLKQTVAALLEDLSQYDMKFWSKYDQNGSIASPAYHNLHIAQLKVMYELFQEEVFQLYAEKFEVYQNRLIYMVLAVFLKIGQKIFSKTEMVVIK